MAKRQLVEQRREDDPPDPAVEVPEWVNPLKTTIGPGEEIGHHVNPRVTRADMSKAFSEVITERADQHADPEERRRPKRASLDFEVTVSTRPAGEQRPCKIPMASADPFGRDRNGVWGSFEGVAKNGRQRDGEPL